MNDPHTRRIGAAIVAAVLLIANGSAHAQSIELPGAGSGFGVLDSFTDVAADPVTVSARVLPPEGARPALLLVTARVAPGWHVFSLTQPPGGPQKTTIKVDPSPHYRLAGEFRSHPAPKTHIDQTIWIGLELQEHEGEVTWFAPIELAEGVDLASMEVRGVVDTQVCKESCIPVEAAFVARPSQLAAGDAAIANLVMGSASPPAVRGPSEAVVGTLSGLAFAPGGATPAEGSYQATDSSVTISGHLEPAIVRPGESTWLVISATPNPGWHVYAHAPRDDKPGSKPTLIAVAAPSELTIHQPSTEASIVTEDMSAIGFGMVRHHPGPATWMTRIDVSADSQPGDYRLLGIVGFQACESREGGSCELPKATKFQVLLTVDPNPAQAAVRTTSSNRPLAFLPASYSEAAAAAGSLEPFLAPAARPSETGGGATAAGPTTASLVTILAAALLGGLILNVMPCVLPVIGLKILAFAEQGGESRRHIFMLNAAYAAGMIGVFILLATLASLVQLGLGSENYGWGELYTLLWFKVGMIVLVFAMALSFLGVWEIPIPGFAGTGTAARMATQEGYSGAIFKGIFTTILATPCSGPFLGPVFGYTLAQPPWLTYLIFLFVGLGMAAPYLLIGAFPSLIRHLPRPGAWMETFKQLMGFLLLGTVVYLFSTIGEEYFIATLALLVGVWFACWWIGRTPLTASDTVRHSAWAGGVAAAAVIGWLSFSLLTPSEYELPWQHYSPAALAKARSEGKTVLVDFTADWCPTCKTNLKFSINRKQVHELVEKNGVVPLVADWTDRNPMIKQALAELNSRSIPLLVVYPADPQASAIVLPDVVTQSDVVEALKKAGPSRPDAAPSSSMATIGASVTP